MARQTARDAEAGRDDQPQRRCGTMEVHERLLKTSPAYVNNRMVSEANAIAHQMVGRMARTGVCVIPVVVHVVSKTAAQNISDAQIQSQIEILNRDFRRTNPDVSTVPAAFSPLAADAQVEFALASTDPSGASTNGITRTTTTTTSFSQDDKVKAAATGGADAWPSDQYLNVWVCQLGNNLLGYAQFPGGPANTDGVVILHSAFGNTGTAAAPFHLGRTTTHEVGHWLNLRHIWGDVIGCTGNDLVADTPNQNGPNVGCPTFPSVTCSNGPNGDMFMNYMDYVDDACMVMFTTGQVERMDACLDGDRTGICTSPPVVGTLKAIDDWPPVTLKFRDDHVTLKFLDDPNTLKFIDDWPPVTLKFRDDPQTLKFIDDGPGTSPRLDPVKQPMYDKLPIIDTGVTKSPAADIIGFPTDPGGPVMGGFGRGGASPFVLSTGHHSMAWAGGQAGQGQPAQGQFEEVLQRYQQALFEYAQAAQAGQLGPQEVEQGNRLYEEFEALVQQYQNQGRG